MPATILPPQNCWFARVGCCHQTKASLGLKRHMMYQVMGQPMMVCKDHHCTHSDWKSCLTNQLLANAILQEEDYFLITTLGNTIWDSKWVGNMSKMHCRAGGAWFDAREATRTKNSNKKLLDILAAKNKQKRNKGVHFDCSKGCDSKECPEAWPQQLSW